MKFNSLAYNSSNYTANLSKYSLDVLHPNEKLEEILIRYKEEFQKNKVQSITFSKEGFCSLFLSLKGKIAVSLGESEYIIQGAQNAFKYGADITFIALNKDGTLDTSILDDSYDFVVISSYIIDTYVKVDLQEIKTKTDAKILSNATVQKSKQSDIYFLDSYKLCGLGSRGVLIYNDEFDDQAISQIDLLSLVLTFEAYKNKHIENTMKEKFLQSFQTQFGDDLYLFVDPKICLDFTLHLGLKDIKMRDIIRTLAFDDILVTNGEGCSLGLSKPSRILTEMGYSEDQSRWGLSLDFALQLSDDQIEELVIKIYKKYRQIKVLG